MDELNPDEQAVRPRVWKLGTPASTHEMEARDFIYRHDLDDEEWSALCEKRTEIVPGVFASLYSISPSGSSHWGATLIVWDQRKGD